MPLVGEKAGDPGESSSCGSRDSSSSAESCPSWAVPFTAIGTSRETLAIVRALGIFTRETDGLTVDEGVADDVKIFSSKTMGIVDRPENDTGGNSSSGDEDKKGEIRGIDGKILDFDESGDLIASNEREMLLGFEDDSELEDGSGSVIASSVIGLKMGGIS